MAILDDFSFSSAALQTQTTMYSMITRMQDFICALGLNVCVQLWDYDSTIVAIYS